jgi:NitT/TauT family transport system substrate-binding protein
MNRKILSTLLLVVLLATSFQIGRVYEQKKSSKVLGASLEKFTLGINTWVGYGPFWLAQDKGFFKDEGLDVDITVIEDSAQRKAAVLNGRIDGLGDTTDLLVLSRAENIPSIAVMQIDQSNGADGILSTDNIHSIADLKGQKVAVQKNFVSESFLYYLLQKNGLTPKDVKIVDMEAGTAGAAFVSGSVDIAVTFEPWMSKAKDRRGGKILISSKEADGVISDILTIREDYLKEHPEAVKKFMRSWFKALDYWKSNPEEANNIMAKHYNLSGEKFKILAEGVIWPSLEENIQYFGKSQGSGKIYDIANTFSEVFITTGQIKSKPAMDSGINQDLLLQLSQ